MEVCYPFEQDALRSRSDTQLLKIDLPYALSQRTLKVLRPVFEVIQERRPIFFNEKKTAVLRDILQQHFNAPHCLSDKKWKALLKQTIDKNNAPWKICVSYKMNDEPPKISNASFPFAQDQTMNLHAQVWSRR